MDRDLSVIDPVTGEPCQMFFIQYEHDGAVWGLDFYAKDEADAKRKLEAMHTARVSEPVLIEAIVPWDRAGAEASA